MLPRSARILAIALAVAPAAACESPRGSAPPEDAGAASDAGTSNDPDPAEPSGAAPDKPVPVQQLLEIDGSVTKAQLDEQLQVHLNEIRACYDGALQDPAGIELNGAIVVRLSVSKAGAVSGATVTLSEFGHPPTETCLTGVVETFVLPKQKRESTVQLPLYMNTL